MKINRAYSRHWENGCDFLGHIFWKRAFCFFAPPKQTLFLAISNENIFSKTQDAGLGAKVGPSKGLE